MQAYFIPGKRFTSRFANYVHLVRIFLFQEIVCFMTGETQGLPTNCMILPDNLTSLNRNFPIVIQ